MNSSYLTVTLVTARAGDDQAPTLKRRTAVMGDLNRGPALGDARSVQRHTWRRSWEAAFTNGFKRREI